MLNRPEPTSIAKPAPGLAPLNISASSQPIDPRQETTPETAGILGDLERSTIRNQAAALQEHGIQPPKTQHSRPVRTNIDSTPQALGALFRRLALENPGKPIAVISGGSLSGCSTALELASQGYQVVMAEKRDTYSRQNVLSLKTDTLLYWASLSPDGSLLRNMVKSRRITPCTHEIAATPNAAAAYASALNPSVRFLNWLLPPTALPPRIPVRDRRADLQVRQQDLAGLVERLPRQPKRPVVESLDPAWPNHLPVSSVSPEDWQLHPPPFFGADNMVFGQVCDVESALNEYCARQPSIHIVNAAIELQQGPDGGGDYRPIFHVGTADKPEQFCPGQTIALICLAEGAYSANRALMGGEMQPVETKESWQQGNYAGPPSHIGGFTCIDVQPDAIIVTQSIEQSHQSLANIAIFHPTDQVPSRETVVGRLHRAQTHVNATASPLTIAENHRVFDSGPIDIRLRMARNPMRRNVIQVGDTAFSGSPVGGYGASTAGSLFAKLAGDTVAHPLFNSPDPADRQRVEDFYRKRVADIREVRNGRPAALLRQLGVYSPQAHAASIRQATAARFDGLSEIDVPPDIAQDRR